MSLVALVAITGSLGSTATACSTANPFAANNDTRNVDLNQPFQTTPAADWADGADGIILPDTQAVGSYSTAAVKAAMEQVRQVVIAARLDRRALEGHDPEPYLSLLAPQVAAAIRPDFEPGNKANVGHISMIADGYHLLPVEPKVNGTMSADVGKDGELVVHTNYVFAYAFRPDHPMTRAMDMIGLIRWEVAYRVISGQHYTKESWGIWPANGHGFTYAMSCALGKKGFLAPTFGNPRTFGGPAGDDPASYFDPAKPMPTESATCPE